MRTICVSICLLVALFFGTIVAAGDEFPLEYRVSGQSGMPGVSITPKKAVRVEQLPDGVSLPPDAGVAPVFAKWQTPLAKEGFVYLAVAKTAGRELDDRVFVDTDCDGDLADESPVEPAHRGSFGPVEVLFPGQGGPIRYHVIVKVERGHFSGRGPARTYTDLLVESACWYEGKVQVAGKGYECALVDYNSNGTFDDTSMSLGEADRIRIGGSDAEAKVLGRYIHIDGALYRPRAARDGTSIRFEAAEGVPTGTITVSDKISMLSIAGENGQLDFEVREGLAQAPVGKWVIHGWETRRKDADGVEWQLSGGDVTESSAFEVAEGKTAHIDIGEPVTSTMSMSQSGPVDDPGRWWRFEETSKGRSGEAGGRILRGGKWAPAPKLRIRNADGSYDETIQFQYG